MERNFTEQELVRREKLEKLRSLGLDPFGNRFDRDSLANDIKEKYKDITHEDENVRYNRGIYKADVWERRYNWNTKKWLGATI